MPGTAQEQRPVGLRLVKGSGASCWRLPMTCCFTPEPFCLIPVLTALIEDSSDVTHLRQLS